MFSTELAQMLHQAGDSLDVPTTEVLGAVMERGRQRRRRRRQLSAMVATLALGGGAIVGIAATASSAGRETVRVSSPPATTLGLWSIDTTGLAVLHDYAAGNGEISDVSEVTLKETTWANYVAWSKAGLGQTANQGYMDGVPIYSWSTRIYAIVQVGKFNCATLDGCDGRQYKWALTVLPADNPTTPTTGEMVTSSSASASAPSLASLPGPQAQLDTATGQITTTTTPPPPTPLVTVPSLLGQSIGNAENTLEQVGFTISPIPHLSTPDTPDRRIVTQQHPNAGSLAPAGSTVTVTLASPTTTPP